MIKLLYIFAILAVILLLVYFTVMFVFYLRKQVEQSEYHKTYFRWRRP